MTKINVEDHLESYRARHGEDAWRAEVQRLALAALRTGSEKHEAFWRTLTKDFDWLDWEQLKAQAQSEALPPNTERLIAETLKSTMPALRSQAQYDAVVIAMQSLEQVVNALLERDKTREQEGKQALERALDAIVKATELTLKLEDVPEAASSKASQQFKDAPAQFQEVEVQAELLQELALLDSKAKLNEWYETSKPKRDRIVTRALLNDLLDAVRAKRIKLL